MTRAFVALGGNLGPVAETLDSATDRINELTGCHITARSRLFRTAAIGATAGTDFLNAVVELRTELPPETLLTRLQTIETALGRERTQHWGPRTIDLDVVAYEGLIHRSDRLTLPHPHCWYRRFVLDPWADLDAAFRHPLLNEPVATLLVRLKQRPLPVAVREFPESAAIEAAIEAIPDVLVVDESAPNVALILAAKGKIQERRVVELPASPDAVELGVQIVRAALDQPQPVTAYGGPWVGA